MITVYVPCDASAVSLGADEVARAIRAEADRSKTEIKIVRNGSRGMFWLEPLVEIETPGGRIAFGLLSDYVFGGGRRVPLALAGVGSTLCSLAIAGTGPGTPMAVLLPLALVFGFVGIGWNGVQHTWMAELAGPRAAGSAVGLGLAVSSAGVTLGPIAFGWLVQAFGGYGGPWLGLAASMGVALVVLGLGLMFRGRRDWRASALLGFSLVGVAAAHSTSALVVAALILLTAPFYANYTPFYLALLTEVLVFGLFALAYDVLLGHARHGRQLVRRHGPHARRAQDASLAQGSPIQERQAQSRQVERGSRSERSTPWTSAGTMRPKTGSTVVGAVVSAPE